MIIDQAQPSPSVSVNYAIRESTWDPLELRHLFEQKIISNLSGTAILHANLAAATD